MKYDVKEYTNLITELLESDNRRSDMGWLGSHCFIWDCRDRDIAVVTLKPQNNPSDANDFVRIDIYDQYVQFWPVAWNNNKIVIKRGVLSEELFQLSLLDDLKGITTEFIDLLYIFFEDMLSHHRKGDE